MHYDNINEDGYMPDRMETNPDLAADPENVREDSAAGTETDYTHKDYVLDIGRGCRFCDCKTERTASVCEGCFKLHATDWLADMPQVFENDIFEVRFKNTRRGYYRNVNGLPLKRGDIVAVEASPGHDIGIVSLTGDIVARQMKRVGFNPQNGEYKKIYRTAKPYDIEKWQEAIALEHGTMIQARRIAADMELNMKIGDVEYQGDKIKAIFYYIADERVDFRELIKVFAERFHIRVEMKQIGARQEAGRIGGLGSCGRELCCASWISSFNSVTTTAARVQEISLNPQKLAGQCSKLKCCMLYELDTYLDARSGFPVVTQPLRAADADYYLVKTDILSRTMSFSPDREDMANAVVLPLWRVEEILEANRHGKKVDTLSTTPAVKAKKTEPEFVNVIGEESITRFDNVETDRHHKHKKIKNKMPSSSADGVHAEKNAAAPVPSDGRGRSGDRMPNSNNGNNAGEGRGRPAGGDKKFRASGHRTNNHRNSGGRGGMRRDGTADGGKENKER